MMVDFGTEVKKRAEDFEADRRSHGYLGQILIDYIRNHLWLTSQSLPELQFVNNTFIPFEL